MKSSPLFVANWKMNMPLEKARIFLDTHFTDLQALAQEAEIIICPSFLALDYFCSKTKSSGIKIGAQNCSRYERGAYTGEVDALSLAQMGCKYAIIGHSERRQHCGESNEEVGEKIARLTEQNITPIICIGETEQEFLEQKTSDILAEQLQPIFDIQGKTQFKNLVIAYEPVYAIGTGKTPERKHLITVFTWLHQFITKALSSANLPSPILCPPDIILLYGGSVTPENGADLITLPYVSGLLIGNASLDFQKFQNIVSSSSKAFRSIP